MGKKKLPASVNWRINFILGLFLLIGGLIGWRFFYLQVLHHKTYFLQAQAQHQNKTEIKSQRGKIYLKDKDEKNYFLATNREFEKSLGSHCRYCRNAGPSNRFVSRLNSAKTFKNGRSL